MNTIGKISGKDWHNAPNDATHIGISDGYHWYRFHQGKWYFSASPEWRDSNDITRSRFTLISKEEDLGLNKKEVKTIKDLEVGMFLIHCLVSKYLVTWVGEDKFNVIFVGLSSNSYPNQHLSTFEGWSYTYDGEYTPFVKERVATPKQIKMKQLEDTIANASKQLQELKGLDDNNW